MSDTFKQSDKVTFLSDVKFEGNLGTFEKMVNMCHEMGVSFGQYEKVLDGIAGGDRVNFLKHLKPDRIEEIKKKMTVMILEGIRGGIRVAHIHTDKGIVFLPKNEFKRVVTEAAMAMSSKVFDKKGYIGSIDALAEMEKSLG